MEIHTLGIDIGKTVFNVVGLSRQGDIVVRKKFSRKQWFWTGKSNRPTTWLE
jgi:transposase